MCTLSICASSDYNALNATHKVLTTLVQAGSTYTHRFSMHSTDSFAVKASAKTGGMYLTTKSLRALCRKHADTQHAAASCSSLKQRRH